MEDNSFSERVLQVGFSAKPTLKERLACKMFIKGLLLRANPMEAKEENEREQRVKSKCDGGAITALVYSAGSSETRRDFQGRSELG